MSGNMWEWCFDKNSSSSSNRVERGGCYGNDASNCTVTYRDSRNPSYRRNYLGFRVCRNAP
ncbi:MAG: SUMF1/EgtB/PvdO family nonheme iron enzyme [Treponema sp.]|nr:SUMF1/EgtB/PvdO family nonheme iron enzyme [Treponema sp.]